MRKLMALVLVGSLGTLLALAAGTRCPFTLGGEVVSDKESIRTLETNRETLA